MFIQQLARKVNCSRSHIARLINLKKINGELRVGTHGRKSWYILDPLEDVQKVIANGPRKVGLKHRTHRKTVPVKKLSTKVGGLLQQLVTWNAIDIEKRDILFKLSKNSIQELRLILELVS